MRGQSVDYTGQRFGRLVAIALRGRNKHNQRLWLWGCDCGNQIYRVSGSIVDGRQISCGCHRDEQSRLRATHGASSTCTYRAWVAMKQRCKGRDASDIKHYVSRGIKVCKRWIDSFENFLEDMGKCPPGLSLEREDGSKGYAPNNCRWATQNEQVKNTTRTIRVTVDDEVMCLKDACLLLGKNYDAVRSCIRKGLSPQSALG